MRYNQKELIDYCLTFPSAYEDYPFDETTAVLKHSGNGKMFAAIDEMRLGKLYISLKCDPMKADFLRGTFDSVEPAWHFNKTHWNGIAEKSFFCLAVNLLPLQDIK